MLKLISLRAGDKNDSEALATLIFASAPVLLPYLFKGQKNAIDYILQASQQPDGQYSAVRHQLAVDGVKAIGCITLWDNQLSPSFHSYTVKSLTKFLLPDQIIHLLATNDIITKVFLAPLSHQFCIGHLAVLEEYKGLGVGKKLIAYAILQAKQYNKSQLVLDVDSSNDEAISFYTGLGFLLKQTTQFSPTNQAFHRMEFNL